MERQGPEGDENHHRDGGHTAGLGDLVAFAQSPAAAAVAYARQSSLYSRISGIHQRQHTAALWDLWNHDGFWPLRAGHERRGITGPGLSGNWPSQAQEPEEDRAHHRHL